MFGNKAKSMHSMFQHLGNLRSVTPVAALCEELLFGVHEYLYPDSKKSLGQSCYPDSEKSQGQSCNLRRGRLSARQFTPPPCTKGTSQVKRSAGVHQR